MHDDILVVEAVSVLKAQIPWATEAEYREWARRALTRGNESGSTSLEDLRRQVRTEAQKVARDLQWPEFFIRAYSEATNQFDRNDDQGKIELELSFELVVRRRLPEALRMLERFHPFEAPPHGFPYDGVSGRALLYVAAALYLPVSESDTLTTPLLESAIQHSRPGKTAQTLRVVAQVVSWLAGREKCAPTSGAARQDHATLFMIALYNQRLLGFQPDQLDERTRRTVVAIAALLSASRLDAFSLHRDDGEARARHEATLCRLFFDSLRTVGAPAPASVARDLSALGAYTLEPARKIRDELVSIWKHAEELHSPGINAPASPRRR